MFECNGNSSLNAWVWLFTRRVLCFGQIAVPSYFFNLKYLKTQKTEWIDVLYYTKMFQYPVDK